MSSPLADLVIPDGETCIPPRGPAFGLQHRCELGCERPICLGVADEDICHGQARWVAVTASILCGRRPCRIQCMGRPGYGQVVPFLGAYPQEKQNTAAPPSISRFGFSTPDDGGRCKTPHPLLGSERSALI